MREIARERERDGCCIEMCTYRYVSADACDHTHKAMCLCTAVHVYTRIHVDVYIYIATSVYYMRSGGEHTNIQAPHVAYHTYIHIYIYICMYASIYIYAYIYIY